MNPYLPPNNTSGNVLTNLPTNVGVRPPLSATNPNGASVRPIRMQMMPNERNNNVSNQQNYQRTQPQSEPYQNYSQNQQIQQQQFQSYPQQQANVPRNYPSQQQINLQRNNSQYQVNPTQNQPMQQYNQEKPGVLLRQDSSKLQMNTSNKPNVPNQYNQSGGIPFESQRTQMAAPVQFSDPRQSIRPPLSNQNNGNFIPQTQPQNYRKIEDSKALNDRSQLNLQNEKSESFRPQIFGDNSMTHTMKSSAANPSLSHEKSNEPATKSQVEVQPGNASIAPRADNEKKPDLINSQTKLSPPENNSEQNNTKLGYNKNFSETENEDKNSKEKNRKSDSKNCTKGSAIVSGTVRKNIKFFEENDTIKKPLTPTQTIVKKKEKDTAVPSDVIKSEFNKNDYESGVDETPMVHPNLRNIYQAPRKVAKIPRLPPCKRPRKNKMEKNKPKLLPKFCYFSYGSRRAQKIKRFGSNEELLAFFESSNSWRKFNRYGSATSQSNAKDKLAYKPTTNGDLTPKKTPSKLPAPTKVNPTMSPTKTPLKSPGTPGVKSLPKTPESTAPPTPLIKKVPMNKIQVGAAPSPNLKVVRSKVGSLANTTHKPGGGNVKIESRKIDLSKAQPRIEAKNDQYKPSGGDKKIEQVKLQWSAKSKIGSLENATYKPGGGDKKIESVKLDFKEKAKPKVGSKDNVKHVPGGGNIKIENQKLEFKAQSKVGSLDNVKHKPGGGDIKIFDDKTYLRQVSGNCSEGRASGTQSVKDLVIENEVEGKSAPATPGRKTTVKVRKTTSFHNFEETPKTEKVTEVVVTSQSLKNSENNTSLKQQVKVTYSKSPPMNDKNAEGNVEMIKVPAKDYAPVLRPGLSKKDVFGSFEAEEIQKFSNF